MQATVDQIKDAYLSAYGLLQRLRSMPPLRSPFGFWLCPLYCPNRSGQLLVVAGSRLSVRATTAPNRLGSPPEREVRSSATSKGHLQNDLFRSWAHTKPMV